MQKKDHVYVCMSINVRICIHRYMYICVCIYTQSSMWIGVGIRSVRSVRTQM